MTKHHHTGPLSDPNELLRTIEAFLSTCRRPAILEYGDDLLPLLPGHYALELRSGRLWIDAWHEQRSISRRITGVERVSLGLLDCLIHRFAGQSGKLTFLDVERPQTAHRKLSGSRGSFAEQFRRMLTRQFPGWKLETLTTSMDLQRSLSPVYPRARLIRGSQQIAAMACPGAEAESGLLTFALIWLDQLRRYSERTHLCLFLPDGCGALTAQRLRWLDTGTLRARVFRYNQHGSAGEVDPQDLGNIDTRVTRQYRSPDAQSPLLRRLGEFDSVGTIPELNGEWSIRSRGVQFARLRNGDVLLGLGEPISATEEEVLSFAEHMHSLPTVAPAEERWLESGIRRHPECIHPGLRADLLHGQVLTFAGLDRDLVDLLGVTHEGQLAVLELKAHEDIHLAVQALDYWIRIGHHAERGELAHLFPGVPLRSDRPLLYLIAPALALHPATETVLRYFYPEINVERVGVNTNWQQGIKVVMRLQGAASPQSHGNYEYHHRPYQHQESDHEPQPRAGSSPERA